MNNLKVVLPGGRVRTFLSKEHVDRPLGFRVLVSTPEGKGTTGIALGYTQEEPQGEIVSFPDDRPLITERQMELVKDLASHYAIPWGILLFELLPSAFLWRREKVVKLTGRKAPKLDRDSQKIIEYLRRRKEVPYESLVKRFSFRSIQFLKRKGFISIEESWRIPPVESRFFRLKVSPDAALSRVRSDERKRLLDFLSRRLYVSEEELKEEGFRLSTLRDLVRRGLVEEFYEYVGAIKEIPLRSPPATYSPEEPKKVLLWDRFDRVLDHVEETCLKELSRGGSVLILFPETRYIPHVRERLYPAVGDRLLEIHSAIRPKKLIENWFLARSRPSVTLTTFKGVLCPHLNLRSVLLFDESSYGVKLRGSRQIDMRRVAVILGRSNSSKVIFLTPSPTLSSYLWIKRAGRFIKPDLSDLEVRIVKRQMGEVLNEEVAALLEEEKETLLVIPGEGHSYLRCDSCRSLQVCLKCDVYLVYSREKDRAFCPRCGRRYDLKRCTFCGSTLSPFRQGVEEIRRLLEGKEHIRITARIRWNDRAKRVILLRADHPMAIPSYRSREISFLHLARASLVAEEELIVQTAYWEEEPFVSFKNKDIERFLNGELERRKEKKLPPFYRTFLLKTPSESLARSVYESFYPFVRMSYDSEKGLYTLLVSFREKETLKAIMEIVKRERKLIREFALDYNL